MTNSRVTLDAAIASPLATSSRLDTNRPEQEGLMNPAKLKSVFCDVMSQVASPVTVVTAMHESGPHGTTVSAFASLSLAPPMVVVSLNRSSDLLRVIRDAGFFGVNILGSKQAALATAFAKKGGSDKFTGHPWVLDYGVPRLPDTPGWVACAVANLVEGGDHVLVLGNVLAAEDQQRAPLTYHDRAFGTHRSLGV